MEMYMYGGYKLREVALEQLEHLKLVDKFNK